MKVDRIKLEYYCIKSYFIILRYKHGGPSLETTRRNPFCEMSWVQQEERKEGRRVKRIRVDLTRVPTLYWQAWLRAAGCKRVLRDRWLVLSSRIDWERECEISWTWDLWGWNVEGDESIWPLLSFIHSEKGYTIPLFT